LEGNITFEAQLRYEQNQRGIIGGFFTFAGPADTHDEIDFEAMSNSFTQIQTNIYRNEPLGDGHFQYHYLPNSSLSTFHTYKIIWEADAVTWYVDSNVVRIETDRVPTKPMALHFNIWAGPASWPTGDSSLQPAQKISDDKTFFFDVKAVKVQLNKI
jgi:beta-glucanase (GH16 family)